MAEKMDSKQAEAVPSRSEEKLAALTQIVAERMRGEFVDMKEGRARTEKMLAEKRKMYGL